MGIVKQTYKKGRVELNSLRLIFRVKKMAACIHNLEDTAHFRELNAPSNRSLP